MQNDIPCENGKVVYIQAAHGPQRSPEYERLYTYFLSKGFIIAYSQSPHRTNKNKQWE